MSPHSVMANDKCSPVPATIPGTLLLLTHLILATALGGGFCCDVRVLKPRLP